MPATWFKFLISLTVVIAVLAAIFTNSNAAILLLGGAIILLAIGTLLNLTSKADVKAHFNPKNPQLSVDQETEIALTSLKDLKVTSFIDSCNEMPQIAKKIQNQAPSDLQQYLILYLVERLYAIEERALNEPASLFLTTSFRTTLRVVLEIYENYPDASRLALQQMGDITVKAVSLNQIELARMSSCMLFETARSSLNQPPASGFGLFLVGISQEMERIAQAIFKKDKTAAIAPLTSPFKELRNEIGRTRANDHPESVIVLGELDRIIGDFANLELVMRQRPPITPEPPQDTRSEK